MIKSKKLLVFHCILFWALTAAIAFIIFDFSADTAEESAEISEGLLTRLIELIGRYISHNFLRKAAHFCEFAALGFFCYGAVRFTFNKKNVLYSLIPCVLYSAGDEIHQIFVPGRACRLFDIFVDTCGITAGILMLLLIFVIVYRLAEKSKKRK